MILKRADSGDADFRDLVEQLDAYLAEIDGDEHAYYAQFNGLEKIANVVIVYDGDQAVGCGAFKAYSDRVVEIKRMYVRPELRGRKIGAHILDELEVWAREFGYSECILETGHRQQAAVRLYKNHGYEVIPNYDQYAGIESSVCMKKELIAPTLATV